MADSFFECSNTNVKVEFRILGNNLDVNYITKTLSVEPTECWVKGSKVKNKKYNQKILVLGGEVGMKNSLI